MRVIAGIDPGLSGAVAAILVTDGQPTFLSVIDAPISSDGSKRQINVDRLASWIEKWEPAEAVMENVQPMGGAGEQSRPMNGASAFRFGIAVGQIRAAFQVYRIPVTLVVPRVWKAHYALKGKAKEEARQLAIKLLPEAAPELRRMLDHNRAESLLLALYQAERRGFL